MEFRTFCLVGPGSKDKPAILVVGQTPPPIHGQAIMIQEFLRGDYQSFTLAHVPMRFSRSIDDTGSLRAAKVLEIGRVLKGIYAARLRHGCETLYYPPSGFALSGVLRDVALLSLTRWLFKRTVFHLHAGGLTERRARLPLPLRWLFDHALGRPDLAIAVSATTLTDAECLHPQRALTVHNGIADNYAGRAHIAKPRLPVPRILYMGTLREDKGIMILLEAACLLKSRGYSFALALAGGFASPAFEQQVSLFLEERGLCDQVAICGIVEGEDKFRLFAESDIFCFPSHYSAENFPLVLLEAMSFGLPVVATAWRGIAEAVDGRNGFLVPIKNSQAVAEKLAVLLQDPEARRRLGQNGRARYLAEFTVAAFRSRMEDAVAAEIS
jgi:glycosyltransferase involved in cell wall biosynthesis